MAHLLKFFPDSCQLSDEGLGMNPDSVWLVDGGTFINVVGIINLPHIQIAQETVSHPPSLIYVNPRSAIIIAQAMDGDNTMSAISVNFVYGARYTYS